MKLMKMPSYPLTQGDGTGVKTPQEEKMDYLWMSLCMAEISKVCGRYFIRSGSKELFDLSNWFLQDAVEWGKRSANINSNGRKTITS